MRIIGLAPNAWDGLWVSRQQLLSRMAPRHSVVYSNGAWYSWDRHRPEWRGAPLLGGFSRCDGVWVDRPPKVLLRNPRLGAADRMMLRAQGRRWTRWLARQGSGPTVLHVFHPAFAEYVPHVAHDVLLYHPYDWFERMPGWTAAYDAGERMLLRQATAVIATSDFLGKQLESKGGREVRVLHNGVDLRAYLETAARPGDVPADLAGIPRPWIGYVGSLQPHIDFGLVAHLARAHPEWHFVFIGITAGSEGERDASFGECTRLANVHLLGGKPRLEVPRYAANMDANVIPWALGRGWVDAGYPSKLHEYLAAGAPVVSADLESVRPFSHVIRIARDRGDWEAAIASALRAGGPGSVEERRQVARQNGWDGRASRLEGWLDDLVMRAA